MQDRIRTYEAHSATEVFRAFDWLESGGSAVLLPPVSCNGLPRKIEIERPNQLGVWSSGTTGPPKLLLHEWDAVKRMIVIKPRYQGETWATPYRSDSFAFVHLCAHAWANLGRVVQLAGNIPAAWVKLVNGSCDSLACTPTFASLLLLEENRMTSSWMPKRITLGGEPIRESLGMRLASRFFATRFTSIYATSELGLILKSNRMDGWYESANLSKEFQDWRIIEDELQVQRSENWIATGDIVRSNARDGLIRIVGRKSSLANVAGTKVRLDEISDLALKIPGIMHATAAAEQSAVTGEIVVLKYSLTGEIAGEEVLRKLVFELQKGLPKAAWPRRWELMTTGLNSNAKAKCI